MGNSQTCADCNTKVPRKVKWLDNIGGDWGRKFCAWANNDIWIKLDHDKYLCSPCLVKRQNKERQKQQEIERRKELEKIQEDIKRQERQRREKEKQRQLKDFQIEERKLREDRDKKNKEEEQRQREIDMQTLRKQEEDRLILNNQLQMQRNIIIRENERKRQELIREEEMRRQTEVRRHKQEMEEIKQREKRRQEQAEEKRLEMEAIQRNEEKRRLQEVKKMQEFTRLQNERKQQELFRWEEIRRHEARLQIQKLEKLQLEKRLQEEQKQEMLQRKEKDRLDYEKKQTEAEMRRLEEVRQLEVKRVLEKHKEEIRQKIEIETTRIQEELKRQEIRTREEAEQKQIEDEKRIIIEIKHQLQDMLRQEMERVKDLNRKKNEKMQAEQKRREDMRKAEEMIRTEEKERRKLEEDIRRQEEQTQKENEKRTIEEIKIQLQDMLRDERKKIQEKTQIKRNIEQKEKNRREKMRNSEERQQIEIKQEKWRQRREIERKKEIEKKCQEEIRRQLEVKRTQEETIKQEETSPEIEYEKQKQESAQINEKSTKIDHSRQNNHRSQGHGRKLMEKESQEKNKRTEEAKNEHADYKTNEITQQFLLSEKNLENWKRRDKGTKKVIEHSTIVKGSSPKRLFNFLKTHSNPMQYTSEQEKEIPTSEKGQKDDNSILQEMTDEGDINEIEGDIIRNVLLAIHEKIKRYENKIKFKRLAQSPDHQLVRRFCLNRYSFTEYETEFSDCIFEICLAVNFSKRYWPRNTQIISLCLLFKSLQNGTLLQINTGEGKTCIIAMFSAFLALCQTTVDIVSSSPILAQRDYKEWKHFFETLKISVSCNLIPKKTEQRLKCYSNDVVYGTTGSFASDLLRQTFLMENVRGERMCQAVIVDEVDCMLLDQGVNFTYLSHVVPGMHHIEPILFMIWKHIIKHEKIVSENSEHFFLGVLDSLQAVLSSYIDLNELCEETNIPPEIQWLYLFEKNNLLDDGFTKYVINENKTEYKRIFTIVKILECLEFVESVFPIRFQPYIILNDATVKALPCKPILKDNVIHLLIVGEGLLCVLHPYEDEKEMYNFVKDEIEKFISFDETQVVPEKHLLPKYLKDFVENRLINWIRNAFTANHMVKGREYLVKDNGVVPVDYESTGVVQLDTKWGDCLHQFLEIKHGKKLSQLTLVTNFMSNQEYFRHYEGKIFGVSGTLGTEREKSFLMKQFSLGCQKIPTHRLKVFKELPGIICSSKQDWIEEIKKTVCAQVKSDINKRAVLVICEDINTAEELKCVLTMPDCPSIALYTRNDENNEKIESKLRAGDVIVATNIAGRGTDIEIDESVENAGGLFVLVTFLPQNSRIENQVFGRSARKGQPGSAKIVLYTKHLPSYFSLHQFTETDIEPLKHLRDAIEEQRIVDIEKDAFEEVRLKEKLFARYCSFLGDIKQQKIFKGHDEKIMYDSLHEYWAMWLKMNCETKANRPCVKELESHLDKSLNCAKEILIEKISPCSNISHIIKFANEKLLDRDYKTSANLFSRAIDIDGKWAAIAYYNRAYCSLLSRSKGYIENAIDDLSNSQKCFQLFKEEAVLCLTLLSSMKDENNNEKVVSGTVSQFNSRCQIINYFEENIKSALHQLLECQKTNKEAIAEGTSIFTIALGDDTSSKKIDTEIYLFWEMGLTEVVFVKERKSFCWKGMLVIALGVLQIAVGAVIIASTAGILTQLGWGLVDEGVNDICTGAFAVWKRDQEFMNSWMIEKALSIAVSVTSFGYGQVKKATDGVKGVKATVAAINQHFKTGAEKVIAEFKSMGSIMSSKSFAPVFKTTCVELGLDVGQKLSSRGGQYLLEVVQEKVKTHFDTIAEKNIREEIQFAFTKGEMHPTIDDFIAFQCKNSMATNQICATYMTMTNELLSSENICQFRQVLLGCVKDVIKTTSEQMKENKNEIFEQCKPIFDIINGISCATYNVKQLVSIYCKHVKTAVKDVYKESLTNEAFSYFKEDDQDLCTTRQQIINQTTKFLFRLLKESFEFTGSGILAEKLQTAVGNYVQEYCGENNVGKETIGKIIAITSKAGNIAKDLATKGTTDVKTVVEIGLDAQKLYSM